MIRWVVVVHYILHEYIYKENYRNEDKITKTFIAQKGNI